METSRKKLPLVLFLTVVFMSTNSIARYSLDREMVMEIIVEEATSKGVDPALALAVAQVESNFDPNVVSHAGARGVMQIMPKTARDEFGINPALLFDARTNIRTGVTFLKQLQKRYGNVAFALSHYNGGSRVTKPDGTLQVIPATRGYVDKVLSGMKRYSSYSAVASQSPYIASASSPSYQTMKGEAKKSLNRQAKLSQLRQQNLRLAKVVRSDVDPYLRSYLTIGNNSQNSSRKASQQRMSKINLADKRKQVLQWEAVYK